MLLFILFSILTKLYLIMILEAPILYYKANAQFCECEDYFTTTVVKTTYNTFLDYQLFLKPYKNLKLNEHNYQMDQQQKIAYVEGFEYGSLVDDELEIHMLVRKRTTANNGITNNNTSVSNPGDCFFFQCDGKMNFQILGHYVFSDFKNLKHLSINKSPLIGFAAHSFVGLEKLETLDLRMNNILTLMPLNITQVSNTDYYELNATLGLSYLPSETSNEIRTPFTNLPKLTALILEGNRIEFVLKEQFKHLSKLNLLSLANNRLYLLPSNAFFNLKKLQSLLLHSNPIFEVEENAFKGLYSLKILTLFGNMIGDLPNATFRDMKELEVLHMSDTRLYHFPSAFDFLLSKSHQRFSSLIFDLYNSQNSKQSNTNAELPESALEFMTKTDSDVLDGTRNLENWLFGLNETNETFHLMLNILPCCLGNN
eukprot:Pgem_evm1s19140